MTEQTTLFDSTPSREQDLQIELTGTLPDGLLVVPNFISSQDEVTLLALLDDPQRSHWQNDLQRRVQHYGYRYNYKLRGLTSQDRIGDVPPWITKISKRLVDCNYFETLPDQVIVNEYEAGQGISPHIDRTTCFGGIVASLSLGSSILMDLVSSQGERGAVLLPPRSLIVLRGPARYEWRHGIAQRRSDTISGKTLARSRRISLTFRTVILSA